MTTQGTPTPANPATPQAPVIEQSPTTGQSIGALVDQAVRDALSNTRTLSPAERDRVNQRVQSAMERLQSRLEARPPGIASTQGLPFNPADVIPPQAVDISIAFFATVALIIVGLPIARAFGRRMDRKSVAPATATDVAPRLDRIEQAIEAVAIEVERISEGQRFTTRLMSELRALPAPNPLEEARQSPIARVAEPVPAPVSERRP